MHCEELANIAVMFAKIEYPLCDDETRLARCAF